VLGAILFSRFANRGVAAKDASTEYECGDEIRVMAASDRRVHPAIADRISNMKTYLVSLPFIGLFTGTRAMAAGGLALLLADKLDVTQRKAIGWTLFAVGLLTTIPLVAMLFGGDKTQPPPQ
jgi:hypothetical protein